LTQDPIVYTAIALVVGLCVGSFLNVVIHRLPKMMEREWRAQCAELRGDEVPDENPPRYNLAVPRSACPECGHAIGALENIPIVSWLALRGACKACGKPISIRYPLVEALGGLHARRADVHRLRHPASARQPDAAAALGGPRREPVRRVRVAA
jgi:leader peptidase (prepilin peptidase)/N-methyltransferase